MPLVSVIIPTFNRSGMLLQAIESVSAQTFKDFEVVIIDDGSIDDTHQMVRTQDDPRIRYIHQQNSGLAAARNAGIRVSKGKFIAFLDDDDYWLPTKLEIQLKILENRSEVGLVSSGWVYVNPDRVTLGDAEPWLWHPDLGLDTWLLSCPIIPSSVIVRRTWMESSGGFDEDLSRVACGAEDWDLWLRLSYLGCQMAWAEEILCTYRLHPSSMAHNALRQKCSMVYVIDKFFDQPDLPDDLKRRKDPITARVYVRGAAREYGSGEVEEAAKDISRAVQLDPELLFKGGEQLFDALMSWLSVPVLSDPYQYLKNIFENLPPEAALLQDRRSQAIARVARIELFDAYEHKDWTRVRQKLYDIILNDPHLLTDRGIFSIILESFVGSHMKSLLKNIYHRLISVFGY